LLIRARTCKALTIIVSGDRPAALLGLFLTNLGTATCHVRSPTVTSLPAQCQLFYLRMLGERLCCSDIKISKLSIRSKQLTIVSTDRSTTQSF
jgi:hypothetical protein